MITLHLHDSTYIALESDYRHKDAIKELAGYPDVKWHAESRRWLVHALLLEKVIRTLGAEIAPASVDFWLGYPIPELGQPQKRRRTKQQIMAEKREKRAAAGVVGRVIVEAMHGEVG